MTEQRDVTALPLRPSRDQETKRGGGAFDIDPPHAPKHWMDGCGSGLCARCRTPQAAWGTTACFYPMTMAEAIGETAALLESVCTTTVGLSPREACEQARVLRDVERYGR